jgi:hypothetical protein
MRWVISGTGLEEFTHVTPRGAEVSCETNELGELRVALQRTIDELDEYMDGAGLARSHLARRVDTAMKAYAVEKKHADERKAKEDAEAGQ